jgi:predicted ATP-dependent serine protease
MGIKYCPECGGEYQEWAQKCVDCGVGLVDTKPNTQLKKESVPEVIVKGGRKYVKEPLVPIAGFANAMEARFSQGILESEGIPSIITAADAVLLNGQNTSTKHGVSLVVKESDAAQAKEILESIETNLPEEGIGSLPVIESPEEEPEPQD